ncbi:MAG: LysE family transporter [Candidatus Zixiibacteriota bacterium]
MELLSLFFNSFVVGFTGAMMPGPLLTVDIAETPRSGWKTGPILSVGHAIAEIAVVVVLALGLAALTDNTVIVRVIALVGGLALLAMAGMMAYDTLKSRVSYDATAAHGSSHMKLTAKGITTTLVNPYWFVWWATIGLAFMVQAKGLGYVGPVVFYFGHIMSDFVWYTLVSVLIWNGRHLIMGRGLKILILTCVAFLLYLGVKFIHDGVTGAV